MSDHSSISDTSPIVSAYLLRPLRTLEQARADIERKRKPSNVHAFFPAISTQPEHRVLHASAA